MTGVLALVAVPVVRFVIPDPTSEIAAGAARSTIPMSEILRDPELARLNFGIFSLHGILMAMFVVLPIELNRYLAESDEWKMYLGVMLTSLVIMVPVMLLSERRGARKTAFIGAVVVLAVALSVLAFGSGQFLASVIGLVMFFAAFNLLEASLPSLVSRVGPPRAKGAAIGVYSTSQFIGTFAGATAGGCIAEYFSNTMVFAFCTFAALVWLGVAAGMRVPGEAVTPAGRS
ncbi:MAG: MFS transporter [Burkholderiales bacterium]|nr:MFS transporter [Burkholderiales bacterium]